MTNLQTGDDERVERHVVDISDWDAVAAAAAAAPPLDAVVNCAAIARLTPINEMSRDDWDRTLAVNLNGAFYVSRWLYPRLKDAGGVLVHIAKY